MIQLIRNAWKFRKFLKNYKWYDYHHILYILVEILDDMEKETLEKGTHVNNEKKAKQMRKARLMIEAAIDPNSETIEYMVDESETSIIRPDGTPFLMYSGTFKIKPHVPFSVEYMLGHDDRMEDQNISIAFHHLGRTLNNFWD